MFQARNGLQSQKRWCLSRAQKHFAASRFATAKPNAILKLFCSKVCGIHLQLHLFFNIRKWVFSRAGVSQRFTRGPHKLLHNSSRVRDLTQYDCFGICYIVQNEKMYCKYIIFSFVANCFAATWKGYVGRIWVGGRSLENTTLESREGVRNLRSAWTFNMTRIRIFITQVRTQHRVKTKLHDKQ